MAAPPRVSGEVLGKVDVIYEGSKKIGEPYGAATVESVAKAIMSPDSSGRPHADGPPATLVVTYDKVFLTQRGSDLVLFECKPKEVTFVYGDPVDKQLFGLITDQPVSSAAMPISCHIFKAEDTDDDADEELLSLIQLLNKASEGRYPGSLGVYSAKYTGSVSVEEATGNHVVNAAVKRIKELGIEARGVEIVITPTQITVMDGESGNELKVFSIPEVSFTAVDPKDARKLSIITSDSRFGLLYCHCFMIDGGNAAVIPETIGVAFQKVTELMRTASRDELKRLGLLQSSKGTNDAVGVFDVKHMASMPIKSSKGNETVEKALATALRQNKTYETYLLVISEDGIRAIDGLTGEVTNSTFIQHVSFITTVGDKKSVFGFISEDPRLKRKQVHLYDCSSSSAQALKITKAVGEAFKLCAQKLKEQKESKNQNPFRPTSKERTAAPGSLFKCQIHRRDILPDKVIGAGQFGQVYLATYKKDTRVAVKTVRLTASDDDKEDFVHEAEVMLDLVTPGLVQLLGVAVQQKPWLCVIEFMKYGDLRDVLQTCKERNFTISYLEQLKIVMQVCEGLRFMASKRYVHMDVAARNCLMDKGNVVKLADFGLTRKLDPGTNRYLLKKTAKLPVRWVALEALETGVFSQASDVWAFGVLVWEVLSYGVLPYAEVANIDVQKRVKGGLRLTKPEGSQDDLYSIAQSCWKLPKKMRPLFNPIYERLSGLMDDAKEQSPPERDVGQACQEEH